MATYRYFVDGERDNLYKIEPYYEYDLNNPDSLSLLAKVMAADYHYNHDGGWSDDSPIKITITHNDKDIATFYIEVEWRPLFSISRIDEN
ncbi:hypothetical protein [Snodgrassella alvi]|uniref:hypothetical protein n=1 Tax=Snodgrassella alvi TaxID=1196083 RepID=UPI000C1EF37B|nr:hypothetical protein [Snodgrassella alvi]PIT18255.1 hypothetical protein BGI33_01490 [Snodgrassella alvi]